MKLSQTNSKDHDNSPWPQRQNPRSVESKSVSQPAGVPNPSYQVDQRPHKLVPPSSPPYRNFSLSYHAAPTPPTLPSVQMLLAIADNLNAPPPDINTLNSPGPITKPEKREYVWLSATYNLPRTTHPSMDIRFEYALPLSAECADITAMAANHDVHVPLVDPDALVWLQSRPGICQDYAKGNYIQLKINWYGYRAFFVDCPINVKNMTRRELLRAIATSLFLFRNSGARDYKPYIPDESHIGTVIIRGLVYNERCGSWVPEIVHPVADLA